MAVQYGFADIPGARLHYEVTGSGEPLVLIHGFTLDMRMWDDQFARFARHFQVVRYDVRGFGQSSMPTTEPYSHADDLKALLTCLDISRAHVLGLSMGGAIAINFVLNYPTLVDRLILADAYLSGFDESADLQLLGKNIGAVAASAGPTAAKDLWLQHPFFVPARENPAVGARLAKIVGDYTGWHWVSKDPNRGSKDIERLEEIKSPALIVVGEREVPDFRAISAILQQRIADARTVVLPGAGHMTNMEALEQFNEVVERFLTVV